MSRLSPLIPEAEEPGCGTGPWIVENDQLLRTETFAGISRRVSVFQQMQKKGESFGAGAGSARPLLWYESPGLSVSPVRWLQSSSRRAPPTATFSLRSFSSRTLGELVLSLHPSHWRPDLHDLLLLLSAWITRSIIMDRTSLWAILRNHTRRARGTWTFMSPKRITREGFE